MRYVYLMAALLMLAMAVQGQQPAVNQPTGIILTPKWDGRPLDSQCRKVNGCLERRGRDEVDNTSPSKYRGKAPSLEDEVTTGKYAAAIALSVYKEFTANNLDSFTPGDNTMGISESGYIVSADNFTIDFYGDVPDTLRQFQQHHVFYNDSSLNGVPFDPRVIYDRYANRFIVVTCAYVDSAANYLLVSFSRDEDPRAGWNHYRLRSDTLDDNQWFDFPTITVNKEELFISGNMYTDAQRSFSGNKIFQISKAEGYAGQAQLRHRVWADVVDSDGDLGFSMVPLQDGLMRDSYARGVYLASTKPLSLGQSASRLLWFRITDSLGAANVRIDTHATSSLIAYEPPLTGLQLGGDPIKLSDNKVHSGFVMDSVLNFVYCRRFNGYSVVVLNRLDLRTNQVQRYPWGDTPNQEDYNFPSIAFMGQDSTDADNLALCFLRMNSGIYPQIDVVHFDDGAFFNGYTVVKNGDGPIDFYPAGQNERWGDYSTMQRRYGSNPVRAWLVAGHPNGPNPNFYGNTNSLNAYIAEIGDSLGMGNYSGQPTSSAMEFSAVPNPCGEQVSLLSHDGTLRIYQVELLDINGQVVLHQGGLGDRSCLIGTGDLSSGLYFARIHYNRNQVAYEKVMVHHTSR